MQSSGNNEGIGADVDLDQEILTVEIYPGGEREFFDGNREKEEKSDDDLDVICMMIQQIAREILPQGHIWQVDGFHIASVCGSSNSSSNTSNSKISELQESSSSSSSHHHSSQLNLLKSKIRVGDNIEDEWLVVWMLFKLSEKMPNLVIRAFDTDGEFMLIEAADVLPKWVRPDKVENRVFLNRGKLHIVPQPRHPGEVGLLPAGDPARLADAVRAVRNSPTNYGTTGCTFAPESVQAAIFSRIEGFPKQAIESWHHISVALPEECARILHFAPGFAAAAVRAFYYRDLDDCAAASNLHRFRPMRRAGNKAEEEKKENGEEKATAEKKADVKMVCHRVRLTRCLYAQLTKQPFGAPKSFPIPADQNHPLYGRYELGMKLTCGLEMLYSKNSRVGDVFRGVSCFAPLSSEQIDDGDAFLLQCLQERVGSGVSSPSSFSNDDAKWKAFLHELKSRDYFQGEIEGSRKYVALLSSAKEFFRQRQQQHHQQQQRKRNIEGNDDDNDAAAASELEDFRIADVLDCLAVSSNIEKYLSPTQFMSNVDGPLVIPDDDERWIQVTEDDLEAILKKGDYFGAAANKNNKENTINNNNKAAAAVSSSDSEGVEQGVEQLDRLARGMKAFVSKVSGIAGAEIPSTDEVSKRGGNSNNNNNSKSQKDENVDSDDMSSDASSEDSDDEVDFNVEDILRVLKQQQEQNDEDGEDVDERENGGIDFATLMSAMDKELRRAMPDDGLRGGGGGGEKKPTSSSSSSAAVRRINEEEEEDDESDNSDKEREDDDDDDDDEAPLDLDVNLVENILKSHAAQGGLAGPGSALYGMMGQHIPRFKDLK